MHTSGAILVDKPRGLTSAQVVGRVKRHFSLKRVGHCGTLDPMATGLLIILFGKATRLQSLLMGGDKVYSGLIRLGTVTDTDDIEGKIVTVAGAEEVAQITSEQVARAALRFKGVVSQRPPAFSALKVAGKRSYELARTGVLLNHPEREVEIFDFELSRFNSDQLAYRVHCSKGTYVRSIARDIGEILGVGACLQEIRRVSSGAFTVKSAFGLAAIESAPSVDDVCLTLESLVASLPKLSLVSSQCRSVVQGNQAPLDAIDFQNARYAVLTDEHGGVYALLEKEAANGAWQVRVLV